MATFNGTNKASFYAYLRMEVWENSKNVESNWTNIGYKISLVSSNGYPYASGGSYPWQIKEGGVVKASGSITSYNVPAGGTFQIATGNFNVSHNADGTKTGSFYSSFTGYHGTVDVSCSMALVTIPRASTPTLSASTVNYGDSVTINTNRLSTDFTHNMWASFSGEPVIIGNSYTTSATWTVPLTMMNKIPNATSSFCTIYVDTYSGGTFIGTKTVTLNTTVPSNIVPTISTKTHTEAVTGLFENIGGYVQSLSKIRATLGGAGSYGSTITGYEITIDGKTYGGSDVTSYVITSSGSSTITYKITDSRGRTATDTSAITILTYTQPNLTSFTVARKAGATTTLQINRNGTFSHLTAKNTGTMVVYTKLKTATDWGTAKNTITSTTGTIGGTIELTGHSDTLSYDVKVVFYDEFTSANPSTATLSVSTVTVPMSWSKTGIGVGKVWEQGALDVGGDGYVSGNLTVTGTGGNVYTTSKKPTPAEIGASASSHTHTLDSLGAEAVTVTGSSSNGKYIKFADGTMICYNSLVVNSLAITAGWGSWFISAVLSYSFPAKFLDNPIVSVNVESTTGDIAIWAHQATTPTGFNGRFTRGAAATFNSIVSWKAIGRWK
jgi:hypothetical protein